MGKKVLILCLHRPDRSPSQRFRFEQYLPYLEKNGYEFNFSYLLNEKEDKAFYQPGKYLQKARIVIKSILRRWNEVRNAKKYDLVFVQREAFMLGTAWFEKAIGNKVPMIFDFDDSIWLHEVSKANKRFAFLKNAGKTAEIIRPASLVFAGNEFLADYARQFNSAVEIIPTTIDTTVYRPQRNGQKDRVCIGWSGSFSTVKHFRLAIPALQRLKEKYGDRIYFKIIGDANYYCEELQTQGVAWKMATEIKDLSEIDIGIMPLPDDEWAKGKCGLKGLQYMALGIPTLMSPVGVNKDIIEQGVNGYLVKEENEWIDILSELIEDAGRRREIGDKGRDTVEREYSVSAWQEHYLSNFDRVALAKRSSQVQ
jgi:glycosyltransferase involved in cell wall biosynthesis